MKVYTLFYYDQDIAMVEENILLGIFTTYDKAFTTLDNHYTKHYVNSQYYVNSQFQLESDPLKQQYIIYTIYQRELDNTTEQPQLLCETGPNKYNHSII
jgi:hypothetical protein